MEKRLYLFGCIDVSEMKSVVTDASDENQIIVRELERLKMDEQFLAAYDNEIVQKHMMQIERDDGYNEGFDNGKKEKQIEIIKEAYANGLTVKMISKIAKLSIKEVKKIIANNK
jgi:predicted transposase YdaD